MEGRGGLYHRYKSNFLMLGALFFLQLLVGYYFLILKDVSGGDSSYSVLFNRRMGMEEDEMVSNVSGVFAKYDLGEDVACVYIHKDATSAIERATTRECRREIARTACLNEAGELYPSRLPNLCPTKVDERLRGRYLGCYADSFTDRLFTGAMVKLGDSNSKEACIRHCAGSGYAFAGTQYAVECFCHDQEPPDKRKVTKDGKRKCDRECPTDASQRCGGYLAMNVYHTGLVPHPADLGPSEESDPEKPVSIAYLLTVSGRSVRQVRRLIKSLYRQRDYFLIHVDSRQDFLFRELAKLEALPNVRMMRTRRFATIWGGASLLQMLLHCIKELLSMSNWHWDFVLNLSESDYPVKSPERLRSFLSRQRGLNFVKSHGRETEMFVRKQGLDRTFHECDNHMWRVGHRTLPSGVQVDGGSDWVCLSRKFAEYVTSHRDDGVLIGLKSVFAQTLLPAEAFFHMALRNSRFCRTRVNNNLHLTNWRRRQGCKCQHKPVVDWCGCSPNDLKPSDWAKINGTATKDIFFARKFEAMVNQQVLDMVDEWLLGAEFDHNLVAREDYWQNIFHHLDNSPKPKPEVITLGKAIAHRHLDEKLGENYEFYKLLELTSYQHLDELFGCLVLYSARHKASGDLIDLEVLVTIDERHFESIQLESGRDLEVTVGTDFDPKEMLFKNFFHAIGPKSVVPGIMYSVGEDTSEDTSVSLLVVTFNPTGEVMFAAEHTMAKNRSSSEDLLKMDLSSPMASGVWTVFVVDTADKKEPNVLMTIDFLVTPIWPENFNPTPEEISELCGEPSRKVEKVEFENVELLNTLKQKLSLLGTLEDGGGVSATSGEELITRIKDLSAGFYSIADACVITGDYFVGDISGKIRKCSSKRWSSRAPDPKSTITSVDFRTGKLV